MPRLQPSLLIAVALAASTLTSTLHAAPPTKEEIATRVQEFYKVYEKFPQIEGQPTPAQMEQIRALMADAAKKGLDGINLAELDAESRRALGPIMQASPEARSAMQSMLKDAAAKPTVDGFAAAVDMIDFADPTGGPPVDLIVAALDHPAATEGFRAGKGMNLLFMLDAVPEATLKTKADRLASLANAMDDKASNEAFMAAPSLAKTLATAMPKDDFEAIRSKLAAQATARASVAKDDGEKKMLTRVAARLNGAALKGELLGHAAPAMNVTWIDPGDNVTAWKSLADLKGKVVVLDFWATWCGPCIGSFPKVKELRGEYSPNDLEIIGVTSLQGRVFHKGQPPVDCKDNPTKEQEELAKFAKDMGVTWTIALTEQDVFNADFGIDGIPFVAILDRDGNVVKVGLHPMVNHDEIKATIDELLKKPATDVRSNASETKPNG